MTTERVHPLKAQAGDSVAVVSPSFAAPEIFPAIHEHAMRRLTEITGLIPVEYPTTRRTSTPKERAQDLNDAFADPSIRAVLAVIGGEDQITVIPHLNPALVVADPKPFLGYSDNTNILNWLWGHGVAGFYGGSTQVHLGPGPPSIRATRRRSEPRFSPANESRSQSQVSPKTSASPGTIRRRSPSSVIAL